MQALSHPFRFSGTGVATVDDATDLGIAQDLVVLASTRRQERPLAPAFGVADPTFDRVDVAEINAGVAMYGPDGVSVDAVETTRISDTVVRTRLAFTRGDG